MPRISIQQFRARIIDRSEPGALLRAYREITRRPDLATGMQAAEWAAWPSAVAETTA
ncbi:hypothetical protein [Longimicrobium sp.]|uniref:hypothetical protein n=1 Tax=Longimicrobium sp. TaxID=2029185 RepID=UPI002BB883CA|nr:hypothetical protein [Longimicrobium sp.]HSU12612.1 hypothetical protein [Longimicrobium sp.]